MGEGEPKDKLENQTEEYNMLDLPNLEKKLTDLKLERKELALVFNEKQDKVPRVRDVEILIKQVKGMIEDIKKKVSN